MKAALNLFFLYLIILISSCRKKDPAPLPQAIFDSIPRVTPIAPLIQEASGIADSKAVPRTLWVEEDSGNPPQLYSLNYDGSIRKKVYIKGAFNRDWEDMALAGSDIYIGDIGDNNKVQTEYAVYKFPEPVAESDTVFLFEKFSFRYPDGAHDAEAMLVDEETKAIYIITKRDNLSAIYKIAAPSATTVNAAVKVGELTYSGVVSAALAPDATGIIVKTYTALYYYNRNNQTIEAALQSQPVTLPYKMEPQGEALAFAAANTGFFTLSEKGMAGSVALYFYGRK